MSQEIYLNHPTFGLLYRLCILDKNTELFTTLYSQRLFFKVTIEGQRSLFEIISRSEARILVEKRLRQMRILGDWNSLQPLNDIYKRTFQ
jgi:PII interaction protein X